MCACGVPGYIPLVSIINRDAYKVAQGGSVAGARNKYPNSCDVKIARVYGTYQGFPPGEHALQPEGVISYRRALVGALQHQANNL